MRFALQRGANISGKGLRAAGCVASLARVATREFEPPVAWRVRSEPPSDPADGPSSVESRARDCRRARITRVYLLCHVHATSGAPLQCDTV